MRRAAKLLGPCGWLVAGLLLQACDRIGCDGVVSEDPAAPRITRVEMVGTYPDDPWTPILAIDFVNASPQLRQGRALFYIGASREPLSLDLNQPFAQVALPEGARSGRLGLLFPFNSGIVQDGDILRLGVQLEDGGAADPNKAARSNCYNMDLGFDVQPATLAAALLQRAQSSLQAWIR